ncbi:ABC transporter permease [Conexibacter sp. CPCC 206217]|uniref:ABC transporter permease n=1 Tax=Conexibacter sp. CPCC 206217 TaxID=3064574 RepID=UPI002724F80A|nr:ABC transporter permease [Conexibacter sp. CPCC 206217]MDO8211692.1 ABC transporter permease [Conexibacter sp. CPCC 206217]
MRFVIEIVWQAIGQISAGDVGLVETTLRTLRFALLATVLALLVGVPLALWLSAASTRPRRVGLVLANAGLGLPPVVLGVYLALTLTPGSLLGRLGWLYTPRGVVAAQALLALPIVVALSSAALRGLPAELQEQARAFGASRWQRAALALREARVGIAAAVIATLGSAIAEVGAVVIVGGNIRDQTSTLTSTVLLELAAGAPDRAVACVLVLLLLLAALALLLTLVQRGAGVARLRPRLRGRARVLASGVPGARA